MNDVFSRVLITGADGMTGNYADFGIKTNRQSLDVTDLKAVMDVGHSFNPEAIIHLAAQTDMGLCENDSERAYRVNSVGTHNVAVLAKELNVKMIYVSTGAVFDGLKAEPSEKDVPNPGTHYGWSKYFGELAVKDLLKDYIIARTSWVFGGGPARDQKFVAEIMSQLGQKEIRVVSNQTGSPTFAKDLISALKKLIQNNEKGIFHLVNSGIATRYDVAQKISELKKSRTKIIPVRSDFFESEISHISNHGLKNSIYPMRPWQEALGEYIKTEWN